jgi:hypothetical protein
VDGTVFLPSPWSLEHLPRLEDHHIGVNRASSCQQDDSKKNAKKVVKHTFPNQSKKDYSKGNSDTPIYRPPFAMSILKEKPLNFSRQWHTL